MSFLFCVVCDHSVFVAATTEERRTTNIELSEEQGYQFGVSTFGTNNWTEYKPGNVPIVIIAGHGGSTTSSLITNRTSALCGQTIGTVGDVGTKEVAAAIMARFATVYPGKQVHYVVSHLSRGEVDMNRDLDDCAVVPTEIGAEGEDAWRDYHDTFILDAINLATNGGMNRAIVIDLHRHFHDNAARIEIGMLHTPEQLRNPTGHEAANSLYAFLATHPTQSFTQLLRHMGTQFELGGYPSVPSIDDVATEAGEEYAKGLVSLERYGCQNNVSAMSCAVQLEHNYAGLLDTAPNRATYAITHVAMLGATLPEFGISW